MRRTFNVPIEVVKVAVVVMADHPSGLDRARPAGPRFAPRHPKKGRSMVARRIPRSVSGAVSALGAMLLVVATGATALAVVPLTTVSTALEWPTSDSGIQPRGGLCDDSLPSYC